VPWELRPQVIVWRRAAPAEADFIDIDAELTLDDKFHATKRGWRYEAPVMPAIKKYLSKLRIEAGQTTYLELFVDFACYTGILPAFVHGKTLDVATAYKTFVSVIAAFDVLYKLDRFQPPSRIRTNLLNDYNIAKQQLTMPFKVILRCPDRVEQFFRYTAEHTLPTSNLQFQWPPDLCLQPTQNILESFDSLGNQIRRSIGLPPSAATQKADDIRAEKIADHNKQIHAGSRFGHVLELITPDLDEFTLQNFKARYPSAQRLHCTACHLSWAGQKMKQVTGFTHCGPLI
jgi:hypothetical protein